MARSPHFKMFVLFLCASALAAFLARDTTVFAVGADSSSPSRSEKHGDGHAAGSSSAADSNEADIAIAGAPQSFFPPFAETEFERSVIHLPIRRSNEREPREILELTAFMRLEREAPVRNTIGYRQVEFTIKEWELFGYSEELGAHVAFSASPDVVQPKSLILSLQKTSDYPALIVYNAIYDVYLDGRKIVSQRPGVAMARGILEIPPRNITVAFQKPISLGHLDLDPENALAERNHGDCSLNPDDYRCKEIDPGTCDDMTPIFESEFLAGMNEAKSLRLQLSTLKQKPTGSGAAPASAGQKKR